MDLDRNLILNNLRDAYDTFASLGLEKVISVEIYDLNTGKKKYTVDTTGLQLTKNTIQIAPNYQFLTEAYPSVYIMSYNRPMNPDDSTKVLDPGYTQKVSQEDDLSKRYSVQSVNSILKPKKAEIETNPGLFQLIVLKLKP